jgi:hypothetical protein
LSRHVTKQGELSPWSVRRKVSVKSVGRVVKKRKAGGGGEFLPLVVPYGRTSGEV